MNKQTYGRLHTHTLSEHVGFVPTRDQYELVHLESPALSAMTDFYVTTPLTTTEQASVHSALQQMKLSKVRSLFVVNQEDEIVGHLSARDIQSTKLILAAQHHAVKQTEVTVKMMMLGLQDMHTLQFSELSNARVGHIVRLLYELQVNYIFVIEKEKDGLTKVRGLFSISRISLQLGENVMANLSSHSLIEMNHII